MKKTIKISGSFEGVVATGPYQNQRPGFLAEETFEVEVAEGENIDELIFSRQKELQERSYQNFKDAEQKAIVERIERERKDFRWYKLSSGETVPSVTSVINFDADFFEAPHLLREYAAQGSIFHALVSNYFQTGKWAEAKDLPECWVDLVIVSKGELKLPVEGFNFPGFLEKYPVKAQSWDKVVLNEKDRYGGTLDFFGMTEREDGKDVLTICDIKRTPDKFRGFMQTAAYAKALEVEGFKVQRMWLIVANPDKTAQGFSKPVVSDEIDKYYALFLAKRADFRRRYGI